MGWGRLIRAPTAQNQLGPAAWVGIEGKGHSMGENGRTQGTELTQALHAQETLGDWFN